MRGAGAARTIARLTVSHFGGGRRFVSGNRCERGDTQRTEKTNALPDMYDYTYKRLFSYQPLDEDKAVRGRIGIPRVLGMYENYPFWHTFFTELGTGSSCRRVLRATFTSRVSRAYRPSRFAIPLRSPTARSESSSTAALKRYSCRVSLTKKKEQKKAANNYNCPIVTSYAENIKNTCRKSGKRRDFSDAFLPMDSIGGFRSGS
jgi:hypothetical protein